ncbi:hypothetical protein ACFL1G_11865 [Planctomycetota bacterium]
MPSMRKLLYILLILSLSRPCYSFDFAPEFGMPVIRNNKVYTHYGSHSDEIICIDEASKSVEWRYKLDQAINSIYPGKDNEIIVSLKGKKVVTGFGWLGPEIDFQPQSTNVYIFDTDSKGIKERHNVRGTIFGVTKDGQGIYYTYIYGVSLYSRKDKKDLWDVDVNTPNFDKTPFICGEYVFVRAKPRYTTRKRYELYELICIKTSDPSVVWREEVKGRSSFRSSFDLKDGTKYILCTTDHAVRLLDKASGEELKRYESSVADFHGADFWGDDRIILSIGGEYPVERTIRILDTESFEIISEFEIGETARGPIKVFGDISLLGGNGIDLVKKEIIWTSNNKANIIFMEIHNGLVYCVKKYSYNKDIHNTISVVNPTTGHEQTLYSITDRYSLRRALQY